MKATGVVRRVDNLGRVVIPKELRRTYGINIGDTFEFLTMDDHILLRRYQLGCVLCGEPSEGLIDFKGKNVCPCCIEELKAGDFDD
jgi:transcriptional pleiotropic regulator of transition state genes